MTTRIRARHPGRLEGDLIRRWLFGISPAFRRAGLMGTIMKIGTLDPLPRPWHISLLFLASLASSRLRPGSFVPFRHYIGIGTFHGIVLLLNHLLVCNYVPLTSDRKSRVKS